MSTLNDYYTSDEVRELFGWTSRAAVVQTAKREGWRIVKIGKSNIYLKEDVRGFYTVRKRRELIKKANWIPVTRALLRDDTLDMQCPVCASFAIGDGIHWLCVSGHTDKTAVSQQGESND